ncbi:unnamed protein product [Spirodela intermedia]|uniref:RRM domain-containing protein n=1 Tax=Spirodela intermedia TaxID=51605 RepID=A0A7I8LCA2_SPIIN|nr:unnamed protein product [Spirodela intermedia]
MKFTYFIFYRIFGISFTRRLNRETTSDKLQEAFSRFGQVVDGFSRGFGFVQYATLEDAAAGKKGMDGKFLDGWVILGDYSRPRPPPFGVISHPKSTLDQPPLSSQSQPCYRFKDSNNRASSGNNQFSVGSLLNLRFRIKVSINHNPQSWASSHPIPSPSLLPVGFTWLL